MKKILIIEDDLLLQRLFAQVFSSGGFETDSAIDGTQGLNKLKDPSLGFSAVILDIMLPDKSGFDILAEIKDVEHLKSVPIIVASNLSGQEDIDKAMNLGATTYLIKSQYDPHDVVKKVSEIINKKG